MNGLEILRSSKLQNMSQEWQGDGSVIIVVTRHGEDKAYRFCVRNLYQDNEELLWEGEPPKVPSRKKEKSK